MAETELSAKQKLKQEVETLGSALALQFKTARASTKGGDLEALRTLAEGNGTCRFKVKDWSDPILTNELDGQTALLQTFLLLLWQNGTLEKASYDPVDLRIAREKVAKVKCSDKQKDKLDSAEEKIKNAEEIEPESKKPNVDGDERIKASQEETQEVILAEDGTNYLVGPTEINLYRTDHYHPLFSTYRKSTDIRKENFLSSKHLQHIRKLSGVDAYSFGYKFCRAVLEKVAPSVEELRTRPSRLDELDMFLDLQFPRLSRLYIWMIERFNIQDGSTFQFPPPLQDNVGLRWLCARLPRPQLESLLRHNAKTLVELQLQIEVFDDLEFLISCGLGTGGLRKLRLIRGKGCVHNRADCKRQVDAVRCSLPGVAVICDWCCVSDKSCGVDHSIVHYYPRGGWDHY